MQIIKLTTPWRHDFLTSQIPVSKDIRFEIDNDVRDCDFWIIWGGLGDSEQQHWAKCAPENVWFMTDEVHDKKKFNPNFLKQFHQILTNRHDIQHNRIIRIHEFNHWHLKKSFADVFHEKPILKTKMLSVVCSDLSDLPGHKSRYALVNRLIGHFKDKLDVYGRGFNPINDKWDALAPYKYSIAIENNSYPGYFTEKLSECYLAHTFPIYYGAPDIDNYFDGRSMLPIDITDYKSCITNIEQLLNEDPYHKIESLLIEQKIRYLKNFHLFSAIQNLIQTRFAERSDLHKEKIIIRSQPTFEKFYHTKKVARKLKALLE